MKTLTQRLDFVATIPPFHRVNFLDYTFTPANSTCSNIYRLICGISRLDIIDEMKKIKLLLSEPYINFNEDIIAIKKFAHLRNLYTRQDYQERFYILMNRQLSSLISLLPLEFRSEIFYNLDTY